MFVLFVCECDVVYIVVFSEFVYFVYVCVGVLYARGYIIYGNVFVRVFE